MADYYFVPNNNKRTFFAHQKTLTIGQTKSNAIKGITTDQNTPEVLQCNVNVMLISVYKVLIPNINPKRNIRK